MTSGILACLQNILHCEICFAFKLSSWDWNLIAGHGDPFAPSRAVVTVPCAHLDTGALLALDPGWSWVREDWIFLLFLILVQDLNTESQGEVGMRGAPGVRVLPADLQVPRALQRLQLQALRWVWLDCGRRERNFLTFLMEASDLKSHFHLGA